MTLGAVIIYGAIVLTQMAGTEQQLTAAIGIFGVVAGYLFGTFRRTSEPGDEPPAPAKQAKPATK